MKILNVRVNSLHVRLEVPFPIASVATVRTALGLLLAAKRLYVFHQMVLPSIRLGTLGTLVSAHNRIAAFVSEHSHGFAIGEITSAVRTAVRSKFAGFGKGGGVESAIVLPDDQFT